MSKSTRKYIIIYHEDMFYKDSFEIRYTNNLLEHVKDIVFKDLSNYGHTLGFYSDVDSVKLAIYNAG